MIAQPWFLALLAIGAVWLVAGWLDLRASRRTARLWGAAALTTLAGAQVIAMARFAGPWWPWIDRGGQLFDWLAALLWIAALLLAWRVREPGRAWGLAIAACATAVFALGIVAASLGHTSHAGTLCPGESRRIGSWEANLRHIAPVTGEDYTGVEAGLLLRSGSGSQLAANPQQRSTIGGGASSAHDGADVLRRWNGELRVEVTALRANPYCAVVQLEWRSFAHWLRYGAWLGLAGGLLMLWAACRSAWRRASAVERIAMRRADQGRAAMPPSRSIPARLPLAIALALGLLGLGWQCAQRPPDGPVAISATGGPAMIAARQSLFGGARLDNRWIVTADALARHGQFGDAAGMLMGAVEQQPGNAEAWLALGDALYGHAGGRLVPAAELAYARADRAAARNGRPASLAAEAMVLSGRDADAQDWARRHRQGLPKGQMTLD